MKSSWVFYFAGRYFLTKRKEKGHTASILSVSGIAIGVMTLMTVISVMNGFQQGFITNINEIRSFHIRIETGRILSQDEVERILSVKGVKSVNAFADVQTIIQGFFAVQKGAALRAVDKDIIETDTGFAQRLEIIKGEFDLSEERSIVLGSVLAHFLGVRPDDKVTLLSLAGKGYEKLSPVNVEFVVKGIFKTGYYEINKMMAFIPLGSACLFVPESDYVYGVKLDNHYRDREVMSELKELDFLDGLFIEPWRSYNRSFFSALLLEKVMMMLLISLIFIVVAVNIFHSMKRSVVERVEEIALMKAVGAAPFSIQSIFIIEGVMIGILGSSLGAVLGYIVSSNVNPIFSLVEKIVNFISSLINTGGSEFSIYSGSSYYLTEVPVVIMGWDFLYITGMALFSAVIAAWIASKGISAVKPIDVLRYE